MNAFHNFIHFFSYSCQALEFGVSFGIRSALVGHRICKPKKQLMAAKDVFFVRH